MREMAIGAVKEMMIHVKETQEKMNAFKSLANPRTKKMKMISEMDEIKKQMNAGFSNRSDNCVTKEGSSSMCDISDWNQNNINSGSNNSNSNNINNGNNKIESKYLKMIEIELNYYDKLHFDESLNALFEANPLNFWNSIIAQQNLPIMRIVALCILVILTSSCPAERVFTIFLRILCNHRASLKHYHASMVHTVHCEARKELQKEKQHK